MTDQEFVVVYEKLNNYAQSFKRRKIQERDIMFTSSIEAINREMNIETAIKVGKSAIDRKYQEWRVEGYYTPQSLTINVEKGDHGYEIQEMELTEENRIEPIIRYCPMCSKEIKINQKTCSQRCRKALSRKIKNI